jgi:hypothetical protein
MKTTNHLLLLLPPSQSPVMLYVIVGGIAILFLLVIAYFVIGSKKLPNKFSDEILVPNDDPITGEVSLESAPVRSSDFKTIRINIGGPNTLDTIPGKFEIISGRDIGKEFKMNGIPGPNGCVLTIGREKVVGDGGYSHIQLFEKTVSRKQAEIHYIDNKMYLINLSETNPTQLNGVELKPGETAEITDESVIKTGEVEFKYLV